VLLARLLNACHHFPGFVYAAVRLIEATSTEIHIGKSHKFLTLVNQIEADCVRLLWVGQDRTKHSFEKFFVLIGEQAAGKVEFICSDMWRPYLEVIARHCPRALNILDRFNMVAKLNKALDEVRAGEARRMVREGS
jgi:transposase